MAPLTTPTVTIRHATPDDEIGLIRLAALDSAAGTPPRPLLLAEVDGELRAALSSRDGSAIADPFFATADLLELLRLQAGAGARKRSRRGRRERRLRLRLSPLGTA
jgi:hypothetical protein